jgi:hypothetical protein
MQVPMYWRKVSPWRGQPSKSVNPHNYYVTRMTYVSRCGSSSDYPAPAQFPVIIDGANNVYAAMGHTVCAFSEAGATLWKSPNLIDLIYGTW